MAWGRNRTPAVDPAKVQQKIDQQEAAKKTEAAKPPWTRPQAHLPKPKGSR